MVAQPIGGKGLVVAHPIRGNGMVMDRFCFVLKHNKCQISHMEFNGFSVQPHVVRLLPQQKKRSQTPRPKTPRLDQKILNSVWVP